MGKGGERAPRMRLSEEKRDRFLEVLGQTGNRRAAAEAIGVEPRLMDQRREFDPLLDRLWEEALDQAHRRLSGAAGPFDCIGAREFNTIRRGPDGRFKLYASGAKRWNAKVEARFFAALAACGNMSAAVRSVGFCISTINQRREKFADFARKLEEVLDEAELAIEFRLATWGSDVKGKAGGAGTGADANAGLDAGLDGSGAGEKFDPEFALRFLKWREQKRLGLGTGKRAAAATRIEDAAERIVRQVEAIKRHRARFGSDAADGEPSR
jgi:hypothetical protein